MRQQIYVCHRFDRSQWAVASKTAACVCDRREGRTQKAGVRISNIVHRHYRLVECVQLPTVQPFIGYVSVSERSSRFFKNALQVCIRVRTCSHLLLLVVNTPAARPRVVGHRGCGNKFLTTFLRSDQRKTPSHCRATPDGRKFRDF